MLRSECRPATDAPSRCYAVLLHHALPLMVIFLGATAVRAQDSTSPKWQIGLDGEIGGAPGGWVQVRERQLDGTRLSLRRDLGIEHLRAAGLRAEYHPVPGAGVGLSISSWVLDGSARLPRDVLFNGTTLAGGTMLATSTGFPHFMRITIEGWRRLAVIGRGGDLSGILGLRGDLLTFVLHGRVAPASVGHETKEDFVTQELPVPMAGLALRYPISRRLAASASLSGGHLPWMNSFRREGGEVRITQTDADLDANVDFEVTPSLHVVGGVLASEFTQRESSREDGNDIHLQTAMLSLRVVHTFGLMRIVR